MSAVISDGVTEVTPLEIIEYSSARESYNIIHRVIGQAAPSVSLRPAGLRTGRLVFLFDSLADVTEAEALHASPSVLTLTIAGLTELNMTYVSAGSVSVELDSETRALWMLSVDFQEVTS